MNSQRAFLSLPVGRTLKVSNEGACSMFLKVEMLAVCCESGTVEVIRKYGAWRMLSCNTTVFVVFALSHNYLGQALV